MAGPAIVSTSQNSGGGSQTISPGAGYSLVFISTEAQNLPATLATQISHASSGWTAIVGTKGGAGFSAAGQYIWVFTKVTNGVETWLTGDSGVFQVFGCITVSGYNTSDPYEVLTTGTGSFGTTGNFTYSFPSFATLGADRLVIQMLAARADSLTTVTFSDASPFFANPARAGAPNIQTNLGSGGGISCVTGGWASTGTVPTTTADAGGTAAYNGAALGYVQLAIKPVPTTTYNDTVSGTVSLAGTKTESKSVSDAVSGSVSLTGTKSESLAHAVSPSGSVALAGSLTESLAHSTSPAGTLALAGSLSESAAFADAISGSVPISGSVVERNRSARRRRLFATDPFMAGSTLRSSIDFTE